MKLLHVLSKRMVLFGLLVYLQILFLLLVFLNVIEISRFVSILIRIISIVTMLTIIYREEDAGYKIIWLVFIGLSPLFGTLFYLVAGNKKPSRKLRKSFEKHRHSLHDNLEQKELLEDITNISAKGQMGYLIDQGFSMYHNSKVTYYPLGDDNYVDLIQELKKAEKFIFMEYFIVEKGIMFDTILDILKQKVQEGVEVRFLYDDVGSLMLLPYKYYLELESYGIQAATFNPFLLSFVTNHRDHRKITVIDGKVGFTGGINLADEYINQKVRFGHWKDTGVKIEGEAVNNLTMMFLDVWDVSKKVKTNLQDYLSTKSNQTSGYVIPYGDSPLDQELVGENVYLNMLHQATKYVYIFTPYLILDDQLKNALILAAKRGVDVRLCLPGIPDKKMVFQMTRSYYKQLIEHGVRIYEYTPGFVHGKNFVCDDLYATVGTINLDYRSLYLHFECGVFFYQTEAVMDVKKDFFDTIKNSKEITKEMIRKGKFQGLFDFVFRIFAPLL